MKVVIEGKVINSAIIKTSYGVERFDLDEYIDKTVSISIEEIVPASSVKSIERS